MCLDLESKQQRGYFSKTHEYSSAGEDGENRTSRITQVLRFSRRQSKSIGSLELTKIFFFFDKWNLQRYGERSVLLQNFFRKIETKRKMQVVDIARSTQVLVKQFQPRGKRQRQIRKFQKCSYSVCLVTAAPFVGIQDWIGLHGMQRMRAKRVDPYNVISVFANYAPYLSIQTTDK